MLKLHNFKNSLSEELAQAQKRYKEAIRISQRLLFASKASQKAVLPLPCNTDYRKLEDELNFKDEQNIYLEIEKPILEDNVKKLKDVAQSVLQKERKGKEMFYLTTHSTHFIYGYMASDIW